MPDRVTLKQERNHRKQHAHASFIFPLSSRASLRHHEDIRFWIVNQTATLSFFFLQFLASRVQ
jgi:hypothetical protein